MEPSQQDVSAERRARLAAERMLAQTKAELSVANQRLASHARSLSNEIVQSREDLAHVRSEAEDFRHRFTETRESLAKAESAITIAERRLWDSLETIRDGFAVFDRTNTLIAANRAYLSVFDGLEMVRPGISMAMILELMADEGICDIGDMTSLEWQEMMLARTEAERIEHAMLKLWNGQYIQLIDRRTRDGDLVSLALNITEQQHREKQLREARERAEAANRAKSAFLANMSHEIRTPMNGVVGMIDMLAETDLTTEQRSFIDTIRSSGEALLVIINDVLDYSKIEAEKISFKSAPFDLERCINDVVMLLQPSAEEKGLQLAVDYDLFMPTSYVGDAGRIRQVLTNLVGNAVKFTEQGHVLIRVVGLPAEDSAYRVHITVEDTGIGIPADKVDAVFKEFQQVENERNRTHDGTGLGLAITQRLIRLMGGDIWVDSTEGAGSGFGFHLTMDAVGDVEPEHVTAPPWLDRALILDDAGMHRTILTKQLGLLGLRPECVTSLDKLVAARPGPRDVILLGVLPGNENAFAAASALRKRYALGGLFLMVSGPVKLPDGGGGFDRLLQRPVLRADIMSSLLALTPPDEVEAPVEPITMPESAPSASPPNPTSSEVQSALDAAEGSDVPEVGDPGHTIPTLAQKPSLAPAGASFDDGPGPLNVDGDEAPLGFEGTSPVEHLASEPPNLDSGSRQMRVLVAEDNKTNRFVIEKMLGALDINLAFAVNGIEAVDLFQSFKPDILFTDISMPLLDGKEATRRIRAMEVEAGSEPLPIVAITAHAMDGDAEDILASGIDHYLTKPLKKQALVDHILSAQNADTLPALPLPSDAPEAPEHAMTGTAAE